MLHPGSRFQMAGDLLETYLLWLIEAHAHASEAGRVRIRPGHAECPDRYAPSAQPSHRLATLSKPLAHRRPDQRGVDDAGVSAVPARADLDLPAGTETSEIT
jgi:hypothetical protein